MRNVIMASIVALIVSASAIPVHAANMTRTECSEAYKAHKASSEYVKPAKGEGQAYWNKFRRETCGTKANPRKEASNDQATFQIAKRKGKSRKA